MSSTHYRTLWISDLHLGFRDCRAETLLKWLDEVECDTLYLVGDIVDLLRGQRQWHWNGHEYALFKRLQTRHRNGYRTIYIPGNHDWFAQELDGHTLYGIEICREAVHTLPDGQRFWVVHGDQFDCPHHHRLPRWLSEGLYTALRLLDRTLATTLRTNAAPLTRWCKHALPPVVAHIERFEHSAARAAAERGFDGVICGHIHQPKLRDIEGILYCNDGDWVESCTALAEHANGQLELLHWDGDAVAILDELPQPATP